MQNHITVLVVDNDARVRRVVRYALHKSRESAIVQEVASCAEATEAIRSRSYGCVIIDNNLPDGSGLQWLAGMRNAGITMPAVLLTNHDDENLTAETIMAGATVSLPKSDLTPQFLDHCLRSAQRFHQSQEQIIRAQEELRLRDRAIAAASNGIVICDPHQLDCPIIYCNPAFSSITGYPPEEVIGRNCRFLQGEGTDDQYIQQVRDCLKEKRECHVILRNYRRDGTPFWNELTISPVCDASGTVTHFIGVQTDITKRRNAEDALQQNVARQHALLRDVFASVTEGRLALCASEDDLPPPLTRFAAPISLSATGGIRALRQCTLNACLAVGIPDNRRYDLETAVGEAAMNAVVHADTGVGHVFTSDQGAVQVRVEDKGKGIAVADLPNATMRRGYSTAGTMGHGFKMILRAVDRVYLLTSSQGTTVVIEQERAASLPNW